MNKIKRKYALGGVVDYAQNNNQLFSLLGSFFNNSQSVENPYSEDSLPSITDEEDNVYAPLDVDDEVESSIFGEDFLGFNSPMQMGRSQNIPLPNYSGSDNEDFSSHIVAKESGGRYDAMSPNSSATGKYQFLWGTHGDRISKLTGVRSRDDFAKNPQAQEAYYKHYIDNEVRPQIPRFREGMKKWFPNINDDAIIAAYHFAGPGNLQKAINSGDFSSPLDANGTSILSYITPNSKTMNKKKYADGGMAGAAQGVSSLAPAVLSIIDALGTGYATQPIVAQQQASAFDPLSRNFQFAMGGLTPNVPIEAEGQEVIETPDGQVGEIKGPSHENGGVDMNVPGGSMIYSDRISVDGKTMAERKKNREKTLSKLEKLLERNPQDKLLKNTLQRTLEVQEMEEAQDISIQQAASNSVNKFALGGEVPYDFNDPYFLGLQDTAMTMPDVSMGTNPITYTPTATEPIYNTPTTAPLSGTAPMQQPNYSSASGATTGDYVGMAGNLFNAIAPMINTMRNRKGSTPNKNYFRDFGRDALDTNTEAQDYVAGQRENALTSLRQQTNAAKASNRNNAMSLNTIRALDMATDLGFGKGLNGIYDAFSQQMMSLLGQRSQLENTQDQVVMQGEGQRDIADRQDRDSYFSNMAQNLTNFGTNIQGMGKNLNTMQGNKDMTSLMSQLSKYGLGFVRDSNGNMILAKV